MLRNRPRPLKPLRKMPTNPKPILEVTTVPVFRVHHTALESYITKVFGFEFDFCLAEGVTKGECVEYGVDGSLPTVEWIRRAGELRAGRRTREVRLILNTLAHDGYIAKGQYTVTTHPLPNPVVEYTSLIHRTRDTQSKECLAFKAKHKNDPIFMQRAATLDQAWAARLNGDG